MMPTSMDSLLDRRNALVARGLLNLHPVFVREGRGARLIDVNGREYTDLTSGIGVNNLGHCHPAVVEAISEQAGAFLHTCFQIGMYEAYLDLAERLHALTPGDFAKKTFFTTSGAEAVEGAVKFARAFTRREAVISFQFAFHGRTFYALQLSGRAKPYRSGFGPLAAQIHHLPFPHPYRFCGGDADACCRASLDALETTFETELPAESFAAVVVEPIQGEAGIIVPPEDFLTRLHEICRRHGILLIADEVQTGVWRTGPFCASAGFGVEPDLVALAKSLGFGLPLGAVVGRAEVIDALEPGGLGGTMGGNPVACQAGLAGIEALAAMNIERQVSSLGRDVMMRLQGLQQECPLIGDVRGRGLMIGIELVMDRRSKQPASDAMHEIVERCRADGVLVLYGGAHRNMIRLLPPLTIGAEDLDRAVAVLEAAVRHVAGRM